MAFWNKPGIMERESLLEMIGDKEALFCLGHDKIDRELIEIAKKLKIIGTVVIMLRYETLLSSVLLLSCCNMKHH